MVRSSEVNAKGADLYAARGYIPSELRNESVSCTLEYAYDDWAISRMAEALGNDDVARTYRERAMNYVNLFDGSTGFFRGRRSDGGWTVPFEPFATGRDYTEATPWHYRFFVPHDVNGLIQLLGGREEFLRQLDRLFTLESEEMRLDVSDVTGLMGQYAHGNEPSHHMAYLYSYAGQPWKTQELTRRLLDEMYAPTPGGIIGNEDCGQMSAWYLLSSLGLYAVCPGSNEFVLTTPLFERAEIRLANGRVLTVTANDPARNRYIRSVTLNGEPVAENFIPYDRLMEGGELSFELTRRPDPARGTEPGTEPYSLTRGERVSIPYTTCDVYLFPETVDVDLATTTPGARIHYTLDGSEPTATSAEYTEPLAFSENGTIKIASVLPSGKMSRVRTIGVVKQEAAPAVKVDGAKPGLNMNVTYGMYLNVDELKASGKKPEKTQVIKETKEMVKVEPSSPSMRGVKQFASVAEGYIEIPETGVYYVSSELEEVWLDGKLLVNNRGEVKRFSRADTSVALEKGLHPVKLVFLGHIIGGWPSNWGDGSLRLRNAGEESFKNVTGDMLFYK